jgi:hypothetical protein
MWLRDIDFDPHESSKNPQEKILKDSCSIVDEYSVFIVRKILFHQI